MKILAIETSCDETALSLVEASGGLANPKFKILKSLVASQIKIHRPFGGVVPNLAKREHLRNLPILFGKIAEISNFQFSISNQLPISQFKKLNDFFAKIDVIAVTVGPGLEPALWAGIEFAKQIHAELRGSVRGLTRKEKAALVGVNHLEGHLCSFLLPQKTANPKSQIPISKRLFPAIALIVSGGHTELLLMRDLKTIQKIGETRDDAVGECFDKVARMLRLPYPGGPEVEKLAKKGSAEAIDFPRPMINQKNHDFSFSGLKTSVLYHVRQSANGKAQSVHDSRFALSDKQKKDIAASFQKAAIDVLITKTMRAAGEYGAQSIMVSGGVAANQELRRQLEKAIARSLGSHRPTLIIPDFKYCTDNADMIAAAAYVSILRNKKYSLKANGNLDI